MTLADRAESYNRTFPDRPPMRAHGRWLEGTWVGGNNYRGSGYYGAYPPDYLRRVRALFPDLVAGRVLHLFSGSLKPDSDIRGIRIDINSALRPDVCGDAMRLPFRDGVFDLVLADTPYGPEHAKRYGVQMPNRLVVMREAARVTRIGGFLVWLDTKLPMFRKHEWHWCGGPMVIRSTNHDYRGAAIFERRCSA